MTSDLRLFMQSSALVVTTKLLRTKKRMHKKHTNTKLKINKLALIKTACKNAHTNPNLCLKLN